MDTRIIILCCFSLFLISSPVTAISTIIPQGGEIFLGEEGLDLSQAVPQPYDAIAFYPPGASPGRDQPQEIIRIDKLRFTVLPAIYGEFTGPWYQWNVQTSRPGGVALIIREPKVTVRVIDRTSMTDISGGVASKGTPLLFRVDSNIASVGSRPGYDPVRDGTLDLLITTPGGGTLSGVVTVYRGEYSLLDLTLNGNPSYFPSIQSGGWDTSGTASGGFGLYSTGIYRITPKVTLNRINQNLDGYRTGGQIRGTEVTLGSGSVSLDSYDEKVVRGNPFSVQVKGSPGISYYIWVDAPSRSGLYGDQPPMILFAQEGISQDPPEGPFRIGSYHPVSEGGKSIHDIVPDEPYQGVKYYAEVMPDRDGLRTVEFRTSQGTRDGSYTIRLEGRSSTGFVVSDDIDISVIKGSLSLAAGKSSYPLGEEILLSGRNSGSCDTYLFMTGPNLPSQGARLDRPDVSVINGIPGSFTIADGDCETWEYRFRTGNLGIDAGSYTIYAVSAPADRYHLSDTSYETLSISLSRPGFTVRTGETAVAKGDTLRITGESYGSSDTGVAIWIFGKNRIIYDTTPVASDGWFDYELSGAETDSLISGQYFIVIQHPMGNGVFDIWPDGRRELVLGSYPYPGAPQFRIGGPGALDSSSAAAALINSLKSPYIDDTYTTREIRILTPEIRIDPTLLEQYADRPVIISGTTNLAVGDRLFIELADNRFTPTRKDESGTFYGYSGTAYIGYNEGDLHTFEFIIPEGRLPVGEYRVLISAVGSEVTESALLSIVQYIPIEEKSMRPPEMVNISNISSGKEESADNLSHITDTTMNGTISPLPASNLSENLTVSEEITPAPIIREGFPYPEEQVILFTGIGLLGGILIGAILIFVYQKIRFHSSESGDVLKEESDEELITSENPQTIDEDVEEERG